MRFTIGRATTAALVMTTALTILTTTSGTIASAQTLPSNDEFMARIDRQIKADRQAARGATPRLVPVPGTYKGFGGGYVVKYQDPPKSIADLARFVDGKADPAIVDILRAHKDGGWTADTRLTNAQAEQLVAAVPKAQMAALRVENLAVRRPHPDNGLILDAGNWFVIVSTKNSGITRDSKFAVFDKKTGEGVGLFVTDFRPKTGVALKNAYGDFLHFVGIPD